MLKSPNSTTLLTAISFVLFSCASDDGTPSPDTIRGYNSIVNVEDLAAGEDCPNGGIKVSVGQDRNENDLLDEDEIVSTSFICNGRNANAQLLIAAFPELPGENCEFGGTLLQVGTDANGNETLDQEEIQSSYYACNGTNGEDGSTGTDGLTSLTRVTAIEAGDLNCANGGLLIEVGLDVNGDGVLSTSDEVQSSYYLCNGANGTDGANGANSLINVSSFTGNLNGCTDGGLEIQTGPDENANGTLDANEVDYTEYVCNGLNGGLDGFSTLAVVTEDLEGCPNGGNRIEIGLDGNRNGTLDVEEITYTFYACNGADGANGTNGTNGADGISTFIQTSPIAVGDATCPDGGILIQLGIDANGNNLFDAGEEFGDPVSVCNGTDGANGSDGTDGKTVIVTSAASASCPNGGTDLTFGYDNNSDGDLADPDDQELFTYTVCNGLNGTDGTNGTNGTNGIDGLNTLILTSTEPAGANCPDGGLKIEVGLDANRDARLEAGEITGTSYVCDGADGADGKNVIVTSEPSESCFNGGRDLAFGYDNTGDGDLIDAEDQVLFTYTLCNGNNGTDGTDGSNGADGTDGFNTIITTSVESPGANCANGGTKIEVGLDLDRDAILDANEITGTTYVCNGSGGANGADGKNSLLDISSFAGVANGCTSGGLLIYVGIDDDGDGILQEGERDGAPTVICNGTDGRDGQDGQDGASDGIFEFYFAQNLDGYASTIDVEIDGETGGGASDNETIGVGINSAVRRNGLFYFGEVNKISETIKTEQFTIVEAILYLRVVTDSELSAGDNWLGVKTLLFDGPLIDNATTASVANSANDPWTQAQFNHEVDANSYSDMYRLPGTLNFTGTVPLLLDRSEIQRWTDPTTGEQENKGLVVLIVDDKVSRFRASVASSESKTASFVPTLYIKAKVNKGARMALPSDQEYKAQWDALSYREKLAPLRKKR